MPHQEKAVWVGLDVSKETFFAAADIPDENGGRQTVSALPAREFKRTEEGCDSFLNWLSGFSNEYKFSVVMESTGCYSIQLAKYLHQKSTALPVSIQNARQVSNFIKSLNLVHKTDKADSQAIARFGTERTPKAQGIKNELQERLQELSRERSALIRVKTALGNRRESLADAFAIKANEQVLAALATQVSALEKEIGSCIEGDAEAQHETKLMSTVPGVGTISAQGIYAELGSLRQYSRKELSSISGLIPRILSSGSSLNRSYLSKRGPGRVRQLLYLDCIQSVAVIPEQKEFYERLVAHGKSKMTARCACMRKLLLILRSVVVEDRPYVENYQKNLRKET